MGSSQQSAKSLFEQARSGEGRYVDMRLSWIAQNPQGDIPAGAIPMLDVGGRWDRVTKQWVGPGEDRVVLGMHQGQLEASAFLVDWISAKAKGEVLLENGKPIYSVLFEGGRRAGKTDLGTKGVVTYAVMRPGTIGWLISETERKTAELEENLIKWIPPSWYSYLGAPWYTFTFAHGSVISLKSAHDPSKLKEGRCDIAGINEAQLIAENAFITVRGSIADSGGLVMAMANPPDRPIGYWVEKFHEQALAKRRQARVFFFDNEKNPHVDLGALDALREEMDDRTYRREVRGEFLPRADVVFHAWSDGHHGNVAPLPRAARDITSEFLRKHLRRDFEAVMGIDLQFNPYPCAVGVRFYADPEDPNGDPLVWFCDSITCEGGDEEALAMAMVEAGYDPKKTALIIDASGAWQAIDRKKNKHRPSFDIFRGLGWPHVFKPDDTFDRNPPVLERVKCANTLFKNAHGKRRVFSDPELVELNQALKLWENRNGTPYRRSDYAHLCDAATYPLWRFFPRAAKKRRTGVSPRAGTFPNARPGADFKY